MPEPHDQGSSAGAPENTPSGGSQQPGLDDSAPTSQSPRSTEKALSERFKAGYGKGAEKGRREGAQEVLEALGFPDLDAAVQWKTSEESKGTNGTDVTQAKEYRELAAQHHKISRDHERLSKEIETLRRQADEARLEKLRNLGLAKGVGSGAQLEAFVAMFGARVRFDGDRALEVLDADGHPAGQPVEAWVDEILTQNRFLLAVDPKKQGAGSRMQAATAPAPEDGPNYRAFGTRAPRRAD
jgi:hypothetical protein